MGSIKEYIRLKNKKEFSYIYNRAKRVHSNYFVLFFKKDKEKYVGFTASKKVGNSVKRNFAKRRMRALFIEFHDKIVDGKYIVVAKQDIVFANYKDISRAFYRSLKRVNALKE